MPKVKTIRSLAWAQARAQEIANGTGNSQIVYRSTLRTDEEDFGAAPSLPLFAEPVGERVYPETFADY